MKTTKKTEAAKQTGKNQVNNIDKSGTDINSDPTKRKKDKREGDDKFDKPKREADPDKTGTDTDSDKTKKSKAK